MAAAAVLLMATSASARGQDGSRRGVSEGGYFGIGLGVATERQKAAWMWFHDHSFRAHDEKVGAPLDTFSPHPHHTILPFVNWLVPWSIVKELPVLSQL